MKELFPLLEPVLFWLGNTLEYYNFLHAHEASLHLSSATAGADSALPGKQGSSDDPLSTLHNILVYAYQQAFYPVSKVRDCTCVDHEKVYIQPLEWEHLLVSF